VLEDHLIGAIEIDDDRKPIELPDAALELTTVHHLDPYGPPLAPSVIEKPVLNVAGNGSGV
jgi:hypothetical protein